MSDLQAELNQIADSANILDIFGLGLGDWLRAELLGAMVTMLAVAVPSSSGAADELEYYGESA